MLEVGGAASLAVLSGVGCDLLGTSPTGGSAAKKASGHTKGHEAPELAKLVKGGKLPPLKERLPDKPLTVKPVDNPGTYCATYQNLYGDDASFIRQIGDECLLRWQRDTRHFSFKDLIPNVATSYQVRNGGREYEFTLRKGMKWSDGEPFTADDIVFWWDDIIMNDELNPVKPEWLLPSGGSGSVVAPDPQTVVFRFDKPNGLFLLQLPTSNGVDMCSAPAHYLKQFHIKYNKSAKDDAKKAGLDKWTDLFSNHFSIWVGGVKNKPTLSAWIVKVPFGGEVQQVVVERNPYYWKVDTDGSQLPYCNRVVFAIVTNPDTRQLKALNGEFDFYLGGGDSSGPPLSSKPLFARSRGKGNYHFIDLPQAFSNTAVFYLNMSCSDEVVRKVFLDRNFRIGLSYSMNRKEMIDAIYQREGRPYQVAPRPESQFYDEEYATQYTEYDVAQANHYLDLALPDKGSDGMRLGPDGKHFSFQAIFDQTPTGDDWPDVMEMMQGYFKAVGVDMQISGVSDSLYYSKRDANTYEASMWHGDGGLDVLIVDSWYNAMEGSPGWGLWFTTPDAKGAVEPPEVVKKAYRLYQEVQSTYDPKRQDMLMREHLNIAKEQFWYIGVNLMPNGYGVVRNDFHNVPKTMLSAWSFPTPAPTDPCQYYSDRSA